MCELTAYIHKCSKTEKRRLGRKNVTDQKYHQVEGIKEKISEEDKKLEKSKRIHLGVDISVNKGVTKATKHQIY